ncbi:hypothetical protein QZM22_06115 [Burkholderia oklahomensis]|uniref:hypothetical protein n=1 Tax=Burkholderia oklahomensis TaxID=342113 RepID=UPI002654582A|nr:hypothetical protein [Burkholderia oklahomensis]MDN7672106.1 hypothetical protein [Burkholderia oklahomensis]
MENVKKKSPRYSPEVMNGQFEWSASATVRVQRLQINRRLAPRLVRRTEWRPFTSLTHNPSAFRATPRPSQFCVFNSPT